MKGRPGGLFESSTTYTSIFSDNKVNSLLYHVYGRAIQLFTRVTFTSMCGGVVGSLEGRTMHRAVPGRFKQPDQATCVACECFQLTQSVSVVVGHVMAL